MVFFQQLEQIVLNYAGKVPVEIFSFGGSFIEEVVAPIPSPIIMTITGTLAQAQEKPLLYLLVLAVLGATGKSLGALILYIAADKGEDFLLKRFGKFFAITHKEIEAIGKHISKSWKDVFILTFVRMLPILPSAPVSITCGLLKVRKDVFLFATFLGTIVRDSIYLYVGFSGLSTLHSLITGFDSIETVMQGLIILLLIGVFAFIYHQKRQGKTIEDIKKIFGK